MVQEPDCLPRLYKSLFVIAVDIAHIYRIDRKRKTVEQRVIGKERSRKKHHKQSYTPCYALWQAEREAAASPLAALDIHRAYREYPICLPVLIYNTLAVHKTEAPALALRLQHLIILTYTGSIVHLFVKDTVYIGLRNAYAGIGNIEFHITVMRFCAYCNCTALRSELRGIIDKSVYHEQRQCLVGLDNIIACPHVQRNAMRFKKQTAFLYYREEVEDCKALNMKIQLALTHLYPAFKYHIKAVEFPCKLINVLQLAFLILVRERRRECRKLFKKTVYKRSHGTHHRQ